MLVQVVAIFTICLIVILERIFYQVIIEEEEIILANLQLSSDLTQKNGDVIEVGEIGNSFLQFFAGLSEFHIQFLIVTHILATAYVAFDALLTAKMLYVTMAIIYLISVLQMFYAGARPFWTTDSVLASSCLESYNHPSLGLILTLFLPFYGYYCFQKKSGKVFVNPVPMRKVTLGIGLVVLIFLVQFVNYFLGTIFLLNIALSTVFFVLLAMCALSLNSIIDKAIRKSTIVKIDAKKYVFYWLLLICLL